MSEFKVKHCLEQEITVDGDFKLPFAESLLIQMVNHNGAMDEEELNDMENPKEITVRITISVKED